MTTFSIQSVQQPNRYDQNGNLITYHFVKQRSPEWHTLRSQFVTSTDIGAIMGVDPYNTPDDIIAKKQRQANYQQQMNVAMCNGVAYENTAIKDYIDATSTSGLMPWVTGIVTRDHLAASPDLLLGNEGLAEFKCPQNAFRAAIPISHLYQMQTCMWVTQRKYCDYVQWRPGEGIRIERVDFDPELMDRLYEKTKTFWEKNIQANIV